MKKEKEKDKKKKREKSAPPEPGREEDGGDALIALFLGAAGGRWKLRVLYALRDGKSRRYGEIRSDVEGITDMMLSRTLRELTESGLVSRRQYQEIPPKVEYRLTETGAALLPSLRQICKWAKSYRKNTNL